MALKPDAPRHWRVGVLDQQGQRDKPGRFGNALRDLGVLPGHQGQRATLPRRGRQSTFNDRQLRTRLLGQCATMLLTTGMFGLAHHIPLHRSQHPVQCHRLAQQQIHTGLQKHPIQRSHVLR